MKTKHRTLFVAFSSQKGGVGKSTFTAIAASILHYRLGYNVAVFDCDFPQYSLIKMRTRDMATVMENDVFKRMAYKQFTTINKKAYPIMKHKAEGLLEAAHDFAESSTVPIDVIFFDLPGTQAPPDGTVRVAQGAFEGSNVNPTLAMVQMIDQSRLFDLNFRAVQTADQNARAAIGLVSLSRG